MDMTEFPSALARWVCFLENTRLCGLSIQTRVLEIDGCDFLTRVHRGMQPTEICNLSISV